MILIAVMSLLPIVICNAGKFVLQIYTNSKKNLLFFIILSLDFIQNETLD